MAKKATTRKKTSNTEEEVKVEEAVNETVQETVEEVAQAEELPTETKEQ